MIVSYYASLIIGLKAEDVPKEIEERCSGGVVDEKYQGYQEIKDSCNKLGTKAPEEIKEYLKNNTEYKQLELVDEELYYRDYYNGLQYLGVGICQLSDWGDEHIKQINQGI